MGLVRPKASWSGLITGSALALHCCKARARINTQMVNSTPCKIVTLENFSSKVCTRDYVRDSNYCTNFGENRISGGFSPSRWNITPLWLFIWLSCPFSSWSCAQVEPLDRFLRFMGMAQTTCFGAKRCLLEVTTINDVIWGKYARQTP